MYTIIPAILFSANNKANRTHPHARFPVSTALATAISSSAACAANVYHKGGNCSWVSKELLSS
jgi:hypothetical protein